LVPLFRIGEVAKFLQRSTETLRRYETSGLIPRARKYSTGKNSIRLYNEKELLELADFFALRSPPGRPEKTNSKIDRTHLKKSLETRIKEL
jgi:DNA-binding transcriptional MerR regulator